MNSKDFQIVLEQIAEGRFSGILNLSDQNIDDEQAIKLADTIEHSIGGKKITGLILSDNQIKNEGARALANLNHGMELSLVNNPIDLTEEGLYELLISKNAIWPVRLAGSETISSSIEQEAFKTASESSAITTISSALASTVIPFLSRQDTEAFRKDEQVSEAITEEAFCSQYVVATELASTTESELGKAAIAKSLRERNKGIVISLLEWKKTKQAREVLTKIDKLINKTTPTYEHLQGMLADPKPSNIYFLRDILIKQIDGCIAEIKTLLQEEAGIFASNKSKIDLLEVQGEYTDLEKLADQITNIEQELSSNIAKHEEEQVITLLADFKRQLTENEVRLAVLPAEIQALEETAVAGNSADSAVGNDVEDSAADNSTDTQRLFQLREEFNKLQTDTPKIRLKLQNNENKLKKIYSLRTRLEDTLHKLQAEYDICSRQSNYEEFVEARTCFTDYENKIHVLQDFVGKLLGFKKQLNVVDIKKQKQLAQDIVSLQHNYPINIVATQLEQLIKILEQTKKDLSMQLGYEERQKTVAIFKQAFVFYKRLASKVQRVYVQQQAAIANVKVLSEESVQGTAYESIFVQLHAIAAQKTRLEALGGEFEVCNQQITELDAAEQTEEVKVSLEEQRRQRAAEQSQKEQDKKAEFNKSLDTEMAEVKGQLAEVEGSCNATKAQLEQINAALLEQQNLVGTLTNECAEKTKIVNEVTANVQEQEQVQKDLADKHTAKERYLAQETEARAQQEEYAKQLAAIQEKLAELEKDLDDDANKVIHGEKVKEKASIEGSVTEVEQLLDKLAGQLVETNQIISELEARRNGFQPVEKSVAQCQEELTASQQNLATATNNVTESTKKQEELQAELREKELSLQDVKNREAQIAAKHEQQRQLYEKQLQYEALLAEIGAYQESGNYQRLPLVSWNKIFIDKLQALQQQVISALREQKERFFGKRDILQQKIAQLEQRLQDIDNKCKDGCEQLTTAETKKQSQPRITDAGACAGATAEHLPFAQGVCHSVDALLPAALKAKRQQCVKELANLKEQLAWLEVAPNVFSILENLANGFTDGQNLIELFTATLNKLKEEDLLAIPSANEIEKFAVFLIVLSKEQLTGVRDWFANINDLYLSNNYIFEANLTARRAALQELQRKFASLPTLLPTESSLMPLHDELKQCIADENKALQQDEAEYEQLKANMEIVCAYSPLCERASLIRTKEADVIATNFFSRYPSSKMSQLHYAVGRFQQESKSSLLTKSDIDEALKAYTFAMLDKPTTSSIENVLTTKQQLQVLQRKCQKMIMQRQLLLVKHKTWLSKFKELDFAEFNEKHLITIKATCKQLTEDLKTLNLTLAEITRNYVVCQQQLNMYLKGDPFLHLARKITKEAHFKAGRITAEEFFALQKQITRLELCVEQELNKTTALLKILLPCEQIFGGVEEAELMSKLLQKNLTDLQQARVTITALKEAINKDAKFKTDDSKLKTPEQKGVNSQNSVLYYKWSIGQLALHHTLEEELSRLLEVSKLAAKREKACLEQEHQDRIRAFRTKIRRELAREMSEQQERLEACCVQVQQHASLMLTSFQEEMEQGSLCSLTKAVTKINNANLSSKEKTIAREKMQSEHNIR